MSHLNLDSLEAKAVRAITDTYGPALSEDARFWIQKGIEGMRLAVALEMENETDVGVTGSLDPT